MQPKVRLINFSDLLKIKIFFIILHTSSCVFAQQNIFNMPSVEVTKPGTIFIQQQLNFNNEIHSNTTFDYGLKKNMEIGLNFFNMIYSIDSKKIEINPSKDSLSPALLSPLLLVNFLKQWNLSESVKIGTGAQMGSNIPFYNEIRYTAFYYVSSSCSFWKDHLKTDAGFYYGNRYYLGKEDSPGLMLGYELSIFHDRVHLTGDWLTGRHDQGQAVIGFVLYPYKSLPISVGYQIPNSKENNKAVMIELTYIQSKRKAKKDIQ
jgi:hypothetical protein